MGWLQNDLALPVVCADLYDAPAKGTETCAAHFWGKLKPSVAHDETLQQSRVERTTAAYGMSVRGRRVDQSRNSEPELLLLGRALARLEAWVRLADDVDASTTTYNLAVLVALLERAQRVGDLHERPRSKG